MVDTGVVVSSVEAEAAEAAAAQTAVSVKEKIADNGETKTEIKEEEG